MLEVVNTEADCPGRLQEYRALNLKEKINLEGLEKRVINIKKLMKNQPLVSEGQL